MTIPEPLSLIASAITEAVFGYILERSGWAEELRRRLGRDPERLAFQRGLAKALAAFQRKHADWYANLFDASFFEQEGAPVLAEFLRPAGEPDAALLAELWARSLRPTDDVRRHELAAQCEPAAYTLLALLGDALKDQADLRELNNARRFEQIAAEMGRLLAAQGVGRATPFARRAYLNWLVDRNLYLDGRGVMQTQRQVQLKLDAIYISLTAAPEPEPGSSDRRRWEEEQARLEAEMEAAGLAPAEREDRRDLLLSRLPPPPMRATSVELHALVREQAHLVVLGDPGSGKTTLLRYLTLHHAQALLAGRRPGDPHPNADLGSVRFPIFLRIADYVEAFPSASRALTDVLGTVYARAECPGRGLQDLLAAELAAGGCLVLLDGMDEIVHADDRRKVVTAIENFVRRHGSGGPRGANHFIVTSRVAGYRSAPLAAPFAHYAVQEMDEPQIRRFLERWCAAVEDAQTPEKSLEARRATAEAEVKAILDAVQHNPGVRRLAGNPLLLRILALIHRTGATLPQRRIELYKLAADTLARTWRTAQGVPGSALVEERRLTTLLGKMAYWMHVHKPSGIATEGEVHDVLGREYAKLEGLPWEEGGDNLKVAEEVDKFLLAVREHTGLFVERAPRRYGFMHLTFEEYYAARDLVARSRDRAARIRQHLHDPRWDEPILLALGFVGLDYPEEAAALVDTAILAQGEEARSLGFTPSPYEEWLARDYRFALRCAGDLIPLDPRTLAVLVERLQGELLRREGLGRFAEYRDALNRLLPLLGTSGLGKPLIYLTVTGLHDDDASVRLEAVESLGQLEQATLEIAKGLLSALRDESWHVRSSAAESLVQLRQEMPEVVSGLLAALCDESWHVRYRAATSLGQLGQATPEVIAGLVAALHDENRVVHSSAAESLGQLNQATPEVIAGLVAALRSLDSDVRSSAAVSLKQLGQATPNVVGDLLASLHDSNGDVRYSAVASLGQLGQATPEVIAGLLASLHDSDGDVRYSAAASLGQLGQATPEVVSGLLAAMRDDDSYVRSSATESLGKLRQATPEVVAGLLSVLHDENGIVRSSVVESLGQLRQAKPAVIASLLAALHDDNRVVRSSAAESLGRLGQTTPEVVTGLLATLRDTSLSVRYSGAASLGRLGQTTPEVVAGLLAALRSEDGILRYSAAAGLVQLGKKDSANRQHIIEQVLVMLEDAADSRQIGLEDTHQEPYAVFMNLMSLQPGN